ncbi:hypothetical protein BDZ97DRAFT_1773477 [Flammula alnicola]|nr:hypothetical protein BDZ97DRAFT_1773477 [Flammula alnicola]
MKQRVVPDRPWRLYRSTIYSQWKRRVKKQNAALLKSVDVCFEEPKSVDCQCGDCRMRRHFSRRHFQ